jgi:hypothetical protein
MSIRDPEVLEALRDEPELLAIADAVRETQRLPRSSRRRALSRAVALAAVGAAVLLAVLLWPSGGGRNPILDRALAAIGNRPVLHLVVREPAGVELVDIHTGRTTMPTYVAESWADRKLKHFHMILRFDGRIVGEVLERADVLKLAKVDPAYTALWTGYRTALADGTAKIEREGTLYGHKVYWLTFPAFAKEPGHTEVAIDRKTYKPLDLRFREGGGKFDRRVLLVRTEPFSPAVFRRRTALPNPVSGVSHSSGVQAAPVFPSLHRKKPWLRAGPRIAGLRLATVGQTQSITDGRPSRGFELVYGSERLTRRSLTIDETKHPGDPSDWKGVPKGFMRITVSQGGGTPEPFYTMWMGNLVVHGVYVSIQTGLGRAALLEAARALRPA